MKVKPSNLSPLTTEKKQEKFREENRNQIFHSTKQFLIFPITKQNRRNPIKTPNKKNHNQNFHFASCSRQKKKRKGKEPHHHHHRDHRLDINSKHNISSSPSNHRIQLRWATGKKQEKKWKAKKKKKNNQILQIFTDQQATNMNNFYSVEQRQKSNQKVPFSFSFLDFLSIQTDQKQRKRVQREKWLTRPRTWGGAEQRPCRRQQRHPWRWSGWKRTEMPSESGKRRGGFWWESEGILGEMMEKFEGESSASEKQKYISEKTESFGWVLRLEATTY